MILAKYDIDTSYTIGTSVDNYRGSTACAHFYFYLELVIACRLAGTTLYSILFSMYIAKISFYMGDQQAIRVSAD